MRLRAAVALGRAVEPSHPADFGPIAGLRWWRRELRRTQEGHMAKDQVEPQGRRATYGADCPNPRAIDRIAKAPTEKSSRSVDAGRRRGTKQDLIIGLLQREEGASLAELVEATGWLPHTTRAALTRLRQSGRALQKDKRNTARRPTGSLSRCGRLARARLCRRMTAKPLPENEIAHVRGLDLDGLAQDEEPRCASGEARGGRRLGQVTSLILKRASGSRPGQWRDNDYDVPAEGEVVGRNHAVTRRARGPVMDVDAGLRAPSRIAFRATPTSRRARPQWPLFATSWRRQ